MDNHKLGRFLGTQCKLIAAALFWCCQLFQNKISHAERFFALP